MARRLGFHGDGVPFRVVPDSHSDSILTGGKTLLSQGGGQRGGSWVVVGHVASPFHLFPILPAGGGLLVPCSLPGPPVIKQLTGKVTLVPGQGGQF